MKVMPVYIALGANLPLDSRPPAQTIARALEMLEAEGVRVIARSSDWVSPAWPDPTDPEYVNAVARVETSLDARELLDLLHKIETRMGRTRVIRWASRTLDLDLIDYRGAVMTDEQGLQLPHPRTCERAFVLMPLREIAPTWADPVSGQSIDALLSELPDADRQSIKKLQTTASDALQGLAFSHRQG
jgi:2-amino-4-hydroxy-6-hydroxymethyldihydropteridine diphosphokinase